MSAGDAADGLPDLRPRDFGEPGTLGAAYAAGEESARGLFPGEARVPGADDGSTAPLPSRARLDRHAFHVGSPAARDRLARILDGQGVLVTTGQQPLLFLGPLYVVYKALGALEVARRLTESGVPALAVFWVGADDHDWPEVGRTRILDRENRLRTLRIDPPPGRDGRAVGPTALPESIEDLIVEFTEHLPSSEFVSRYLECVRDEYRPGRTVSAAFGETLERVLGDRPLAWLDSASPDVRSAAAPLWDRVLAEREEVDRLLARGHRRVAEAGYDPQMPHEEGGLPLFVDRDGARSRLFRDPDGGIRVGRNGNVVEASELRREIREHPERFSPHAALRPVQESWLMPVGATVLGPSEVAYWAQLPPLFSWAGTPVPRIRPRPSWTLLEDKVAKVLRKLDARVDDFRDGGESLERRITDRGRPEPVARALQEARREVGQAFGRVEEAVDAELPGIRSAVGVARHEAFEALAGLGDAVDDRVREREGVLLSQVEKAATHLFPAGEPQERVQSPFYYLSRYGPALLERIEEGTSGWASDGS